MVLCVLMNKDNVLANKIIQAWNKMIIVNSKSIPYWQWYEDFFLEKFHEKYHKLTNDKDYNFNLFNKPSYMSILDKLIDEHFDTYKIFFEDFKYEEKQYLLSLYKNSNSREDVNMLPKVNLNNKKFIELSFLHLLCNCIRDNIIMRELHCVLSSTLRH